MTKTIRLNDLQLVLLSNAAARDNGSLVPLPESCAEDTTRIGKAVTSLLRRKLVEELPVTDRSLAWREEDQDMIGLFITDAGRAAIGADDEQEAQDDDRQPQQDCEALPVRKPHLQSPSRPAPAARLPRSWPCSNAKRAPHSTRWSRRPAGCRTRRARR